MRIQRLSLIGIALATLVAACVSAPPIGGPLGEGAPDYPNITAVDSAYPPKHLSVRLDKDVYAVVILVAPGHSATLLYPRDSMTSNRLTAGSHDIAFQVPGPLIITDSALKQRTDQQRQRFDSAGRARGRSTAPTASLPPLMPNATTYLLVVTSPQPLTYLRALEKTAGWSIPLDDMEALNSVAKQVKSTITGQPRDWSAAYHVVVLTQPKQPKE